jgi:hypothetical protein
VASSRRELIVHIFQEVGASEFTFIENSGAYFGFIFGLMQVRRPLEVLPLPVPPTGFDSKATWFGIS